MRLDALPIFPLPQIQLFPRGLLPLHVFEPRYRALISDAIARDLLIGVPMLEPGYSEAEYLGRARMRSVFGVGEIIAHEKGKDGRYNILLRGTGRVRLIDELTTESLYRMVRAERCEDVYAEGFDRARSLRDLVTLAEHLSMRLPEGGDTLRELLRSEDELGPLIDALAAAVVVDPDARQRLIETLDVATRVELVQHEIGGMLLQMREPSSGLKN